MRLEVSSGKWRSFFSASVCLVFMSVVLTLPPSSTAFLSPLAAPLTMRACTMPAPTSSGKKATTTQANLGPKKKAMKMADATFTRAWINVPSCWPAACNKNDFRYNTVPQWKYFHYSGVIMSVVASQITSLLRLHCLLNRLFRRRSKKISNLRVTGLREGNPPVTGGFPSQRASNAGKVSI